MGDAVPTPEFLVWALEYSCSIRGFQDGRDPERTERQLRAGREVSDARREGRIFEGICVRPPSGFHVQDALAIYGGLAVVEAACRNCPANAIGTQDSDALAGCYGLVVLPPQPEAFHQAIDQALHRQGNLLPAEWTDTSPAWYGFWQKSPLAAEVTPAVAAILEDSGCSSEAQGMAELIIALRLSHASHIPLHVVAYPHGRVESTHWRLLPHCPRCKAPWPDEAARRCETCSYVGPPAPDRKRKARGQRPYLPLARLLGADAADDFLVRYEEYRMRSGS